MHLFVSTCRPHDTGLITSKINKVRSVDLFIERFLYIFIYNYIMTLFYTVRMFLNDMGIMINKKK